jgi:hypothetical protein
MSHIMSIETKIRELAAVTVACQRLNLPAPTHGTAKLYAGEATGLIIKLPGWEFPAVIDVANGSIQFDNFGGQWGDPAQLDRFLQAYTVELTKVEARKKGFQVSEQALESGSIRLKIVAED